MRTDGSDVGLGPVNSTRDIACGQTEVTSRKCVSFVSLLLARTAYKLKPIRGM